MKRFIFAALLILISSVNIYAQYYTDGESVDSKESVDEDMMPYSPFSIYKSNYFIFGNFDDQVKAHVSLKYEFIKDTGIYLAYSQLMFWSLYDRSNPFREINFNPEFFWNYGDNLNFLQLGFYEHKSNGKDGIASRGWDRSYAEFQVSAGDEFNVGIDIKGFYIYSAVDNPDIDDYTGYYEAKIFFRLLKSGPDSMTDKQELYVRGGTGKGNHGFDYKKGWIEAGLKLRMLFSAVQPHMFIQGFYGYGESLIDYNKKDWSVRAGFILE